MLTFVKGIFLERKCFVTYNTKSKYKNENLDFKEALDYEKHFN